MGRTRMEWNGPQVVEAIRARAADEVREVAEALAAEARAGAPDQTDELRDSIHTEYAADGLSARVIADAPHARWVEFGTRLRKANRFMLRATIAVGRRFGLKRG